MNEQLITSGYPPHANKEVALWFIFAAKKLLVLEDGLSMSIPQIANPASLGLTSIKGRCLGTLCGCNCYYAELSESDPIPLKRNFYELRRLYGKLDESLFVTAMKALHLLEWDKTARYCGSCGKEMVATIEMNSRECSNCGMVIFPRISPAVIVLVEKDGQILLARSTRFTADFYSVLAGFVEPGETLEDTIHREIQEEVGIKVKDIRYFGSQPWPFPDSLMIGFTAKYASGEIKIDKTEIAQADWFYPDNLPNIPGNISIARRLIDWFLENDSKRR